MNKDLKDESKSYLKIIDFFAEGKIINTPWQALTKRSAKSNVTTKASKNTTMIAYSYVSFLKSHISMQMITLKMKMKI